jgi:hypothetical protein
MGKSLEADWWEGREEWEEWGLTLLRWEARRQDKESKRLTRRRGDAERELGRMRRNGRNGVEAAPESGGTPHFLVTVLTFGLVAPRYWTWSWKNVVAPELIIFV